MVNRIFYHCRKPCEPIVCKECDNRIFINDNNPPLFTLGFEFVPEKNELYVAWSKPKSTESYTKKFGVATVSMRLDRARKHGYQAFKYPDYKEVTLKDENMPFVVKKYFEYYMTKARNYFKSMNKETIVIFK